MVLMYFELDDRVAQVMGDPMTVWPGWLELPDFPYFLISPGAGFSDWADRRTKKISQGIATAHWTYIQHDENVDARIFAGVPNWNDEYDLPERCWYVDDLNREFNDGDSLWHSRHYDTGPEYCVGWRPAAESVRLGSFQKVRTCLD